MIFSKLKEKHCTKLNQVLSMHNVSSLRELMFSLLDNVRHIKREDVMFFCDTYELCRFGPENFEVDLDTFQNYSVSLERIVNAIQLEVGLKI